MRLEPFQESERPRLLIEGSDAGSLDASKSVLLTIILHELATNAVKYGALSNRSGQVRIAWQLLPSGNRLKLQWQETGGPPVKAPKRKGFGSTLIQHALNGEQGSADCNFAPAGLSCTLEVAV